jgi:2-keto-3-deoxy-L-rhamnonate aldolase RhmA
VPGLTSIVVGPNDLANSLGYTGQPRHPEVLRAIDSIIARARSAKVPMGIAVGDDPELLVEWCDKGVNWIAMAADYGLLMRSATQLTERVRSHLGRNK